MKIGNFDIGKALKNIVIGALSTLVVLGTNSPDFFAKVFLPETILIGFGVGAVVEVLDFILNRITAKP